MRIKVCYSYIFMRIKVLNSLTTMTRDSINNTQCHLTARTAGRHLIVKKKYDESQELVEIKIYQTYTLIYLNYSFEYVDQ